jgi:ribokinase
MASNSAKEILVVGSYNVDMFVSAKKLPSAGQTVKGSNFSKGTGGKGANQAIAAARLGGKVSLAGCVGKDSFGQEAEEILKNEGIDTTHLSFDNDSQTGTALIVVEENTGENQIVVAPGANDKFEAKHIENITDIDRFGLLLVQLEIPFNTVKKAVELAHEKGLQVILNPAPAACEIKEILGMVDIITPNEGEAELLTGVSIQSEEDLKKASEVLLNLGAGTVLITLGSKGVYARSREYMDFADGAIIPSMKVKAVDTTGAGDCFNGALAAAIMDGKALREAVEFASRAAAISVTRRGAGASMPSKEEVEKLI